VRTLAKRYGINPKTVAKWKKRTSVWDERFGPKKPRSTVLTPEEEAAVVVFRRSTLLPLDECLYALQPSIPHLRRSSLHRCLQRYGIARLPDTTSGKSKRSRFQAYPIGYFHIDIAEMRTGEGKLSLFVAIDRTSKFTFAELHEKATNRVAADFLRALITAVPYTIHTVLTDNGTQFVDCTHLNEETEQKAGASGTERNYAELDRLHAFESACRENNIEHRRTKFRHPWTNGQVERMNRTIKDATVRRYHYSSHYELRHHLKFFIDACNYHRRRKTLGGLTSYEFICKAWTEQPARFRIDPSHLTQAPNTEHYPAPILAMLKR
jgi:transposase InsO family protein